MYTGDRYLSGDVFRIFFRPILRTVVYGRYYYTQYLLIHLCILFLLTDSFIRNYLFTYLFIFLVTEHWFAVLILSKHLVFKFWLEKLFFLNKLIRFRDTAGNNIVLRFLSHFLKASLFLILSSPLLLLQLYWHYVIIISINGLYIKV